MPTHAALRADRSPHVLRRSIFSTALANIVYFRLLRTLGSIGTTSNSYLRAAASAVLGFVALGERPDASTSGGLILVLAGGATLVGRPGRAKVAPS